MTRSRRYLVLASLLALSGCDDSEKPPRPAADQVYVVRGEVQRLAAAAESRSVTIRHESIPGFIDQTGKKVGMPAMAMPFELAPSVDVASLQTGDKVEFRFEVRWEAEPAMLVTAVKELPADTALELE